MANRNGADNLFKHVDTNQYGNIAKNEFRHSFSNSEGLNNSSYDSTTRGLYRNDYTTNQYDRYNFNRSYYDGSERTTDKYISYRSTAAPPEWDNATVIHTNSAEETNEYLRKLGGDVFIDPNPKIIRRAAPEAPVTQEQRVFVHYLQPSFVPESGPRITKKMHPQ
ncbi:unnamed protein product [Rotaria sp. Silwood1]|nr:unnamed protein product [Rotaria sp. Silwood1]CAF3652415.1 unnamed protein product [Rotaria sp. Silwood1]CAF4823757.1 unnamed protein product [Rotaria sp. Silwood1]CAF4834136.1 unnamed protein product [Rotaria sp. Silwood1]